MNNGVDKSLIMAVRLKQLRVEHGLSHERLSNALLERYGVKISTDSLINYEVADPKHDKAYKNQGMRIEYLRCFADFYRVSADYLLGITDVKSQNTDIADMVESSGISEDNALTLATAKCFQDLVLDGFEDSEQAQCLKEEIIRRFSLDKYPVGIVSGSLAMMCKTYTALVNDLLDAITADEGLLFDYGSLVSTAETIDNFGASFDPLLQEKLSSSGLVGLPAPQYVRFVSQELGKKVDRYLLQRYGHGYY